MSNHAPYLHPRAKAQFTSHLHALVKLAYSGTMAFKLVAIANQYKKFCCFPGQKVMVR
jgi:hypothetical protein